MKKKFKKAFMFHGDGRNGKGKSLELLKRLVRRDKKNLRIVKRTDIIKEEIIKNGN